MWQWMAAAFIGMALLLAVRIGRRRGAVEDNALISLLGVISGMVACIILALFGGYIYPFGAFGIHLSIPFLGAVAIIESVRSRSERWPLVAVAGCVSITAIALIYAGHAGLYVGTLISMAAATVALMLSDLGDFIIKPKQSIPLNALAVLAAAIGIALLWLGIIGTSTLLTDYLDVLNIASGIFFAAAELLACVSAFRCGGHKTAASSALAISLLAGAVCVFSFIAMGSLIY